jgi:hypothetical protein
MSEDSALKEGAQLALDEAGHGAALIAGEGEKGLEVVLHDAVGNAGLRRAPLVLERIAQAVADGGFNRHVSETMRGACLR